VASVKLVRDRDGAIACESCVVADTPRRRLKGLLGKKYLEPGEGLLLRPASSVHTFFMRFPIDVVFLDRELHVLGLATNLRPWRAAGRRGARAVLELPAGECERRDIRPGDRLEAG
jgi:uncharacterized membrane protein (UPF0127 family)